MTALTRPVAVALIGIVNVITALPVPLFVAVVKIAFEYPVAPGFTKLHTKVYANPLAGFDRKKVIDPVGELL